MREKIYFFIIGACIGLVVYAMYIAIKSKETYWKNGEKCLDIRCRPYLEQRQYSDYHFCRKYERDTCFR